MLQIAGVWPGGVSGRTGSKLGGEMNILNSMLDFSPSAYLQIWQRNEYFESNA